MTRQQSLRRRIKELMAEHEPRVIAAFLASVRDLRAKVQIGEFVARLERGDVAGAVRALNIDRAAFRALDDAILAAYAAGGAATVDNLPILRDPDGGRIIVRFDTRNERAEREIAEHAARLVTAVTQDTEQGLRDVVERGLREGRNPRQTARDIAGPISRATGSRTGGLIGLTARHMEAVTSARSALLSGDTEGMRSYLGLKRRNQGPFGSFDKAVRAAIREGRPVPTETVERMMRGLSNSYLQLRSETIAQTETISALNRAQQEAWRQATDAGGLQRTELRQVWVSAKDSRTRDSHRNLDGEVIEMDGVFSNGLRYPGDTSGPASETINCRCVLAIRVVSPGT